MAIAILDIDGTLVDTNYHHAVAWFRALQRFEITGADLAASTVISGWAAISSSPPSATRRPRPPSGDAIREAEGEEYAKLIGEVKAVRRARELIVDADGRRPSRRARQLGQGR